MRASSHTAVNVAVLGVTHGLHPDVVEDGPQLVGHVGHMSSLVDGRLTSEQKVVFFGNLFLSPELGYGKYYESYHFFWRHFDKKKIKDSFLRYYLLSHESLELESKISLLVLWNTLSILIKYFLNSFEQVNLLFASSQNPQIVVVNLEEFEETLTVYR